uniref:Cysteine-rich motor neuron 1 protein-like isoform X2 n=1 Tax=Geotrypetes seraphini TaxID=260995 RepID=A0A6P8PTF5_GEOSA|nr:cysteine-rich motor neuron 1 protein-like isoform X2 [Geotrypetes seraphini]
MGSGIFFWVILASAAQELVAFNCSECDKSKCPPPPISCPGKRATDPCGCCRHCARLGWEPCGGENWQLGYCDSYYRCAAVNGTGNVEIPDTGVCKYVGPEDDEFFANIPCLNIGCDLVGGQCECGDRRCDEPKSKFRNQKECNDALVRVKCADISCPEPPKLNCSSDSVITRTYTPPGECCPTVPSFCTCNFEKCAKCPYKKTKVNVRNATGIPGDCCDEFYCVSNQETR